MSEDPREEQQTSRVEEEIDKPAPADGEELTDDDLETVAGGWDETGGGG